MAIFASLSMVVSAAANEQGDGVRPSFRISFDIPAQALTSALDAYGAATGLEVVYDSGLAAGRRSVAVVGPYAVGDALSILLIGTGLEARRIASDAITIVRAKPQAVAPGARPDAGPYGAYFGMLQASFEEAFCRRNDLSQGLYRTIVRFRIGPSGKIQSPELLGSTGDVTRDQAISTTLASLTVSDAPPADLPQPIMMVILPRSSGTVLTCSSPP